MNRSYASAATTKVTAAESTCAPAAKAGCLLVAADAEAVSPDLAVELQRELEIGRERRGERVDPSVGEGVPDPAGEHDAAVELGEQPAGRRVPGRRSYGAEPLVEGDLDPDLIAPDRGGRRHPLALRERIGGLGTPAERCELLGHACAKCVAALDELGFGRGCGCARRGAGEGQRDGCGE